jgi:hypothetical protein
MEGGSRRVRGTGPAYESLCTKKERTRARTYRYTASRVIRETDNPSTADGERERERERERGATRWGIEKEERELEGAVVEEEEKAEEEGMSYCRAPVHVCTRATNYSIMVSTG